MSTPAEPARLTFESKNGIKEKSKTPRNECIKAIERLAGPAGVQAFLKTSQPDLGDRTGGQMLQDSPSELLQLLRSFEAQNADFDDFIEDLRAAEFEEKGARS